MYRSRRSAATRCWEAARDRRTISVRLAGSLLGAGELRGALLEARQAGLRRGPGPTRPRTAAGAPTDSAAVSARTARRCRSGDQSAGDEGRAEQWPPSGQRSHKAETVAKRRPSTGTKTAVLQGFLSVVGCTRQPPLLRCSPRTGSCRDRHAIRRSNRLMNSSRTRQAPAIILATAALLAVLLTVVSSATANPSINSKRAQAQAVLAQIDAVGRAARAGDRVVQLRERPARADRRRPRLERAAPRRGPEEPRRRPGAHRRSAAGALRQRRRRRCGRDHPRRPEPRRPARAPRHGAARRRPGREGARRRDSSSARRSSSGARS